MIPPPLAMLVVGTLYAGLVMYSVSGLHTAVEAGARCFSVDSEKTSKLRAAPRQLIEIAGALALTHSLQNSPSTRLALTAQNTKASNIKNIRSTMEAPQAISTTALRMLFPESTQ